MNGLIKKLIHIQKELKVPKNQYSKFGKYSFRSAEDILEAVKSLNVEQGLLLTLTDDPVLIGDWHYIKATATITDGENTHTVTAYARESETKKGMDSSQITGAASSYARKYALNGLYLIDDTKDADTNQYQQQNRQQTNSTNQQSKQVTQKQVGAIKTMVLKFAKARNGNESDVYKALNITDVTKLTASQASTVIKQLETWLEKAEKQGA